MFLDAPLDETGLADLYALGLPEYDGRHALSSDYSTCGIEGFADFAEACGAVKRLAVKQVTAWNNPHRSELGVQWNNPSVYEINEDYAIERLASILAANNPRLSLLVWKTVCNCPPGQLQARYRRNTQSDSSYFRNDKRVARLGNGELAQVVSWALACARR